MMNCIYMEQKSRADRTSKHLIYSTITHSMNFDRSYMRYSTRYCFIHCKLERDENMLGFLFVTSQINVLF